MKKERFVLAFFTGCLISAVSLQAQTGKDSTKVARSYAINEVVVTGTRSETDVRHLPMTVSVVGRPQLEASQQTSVLPVLNSQVPGFFSTSRGVMGYGVATGASGQMSLRGIGGPAQAGLPTTGLLVLIDGHPQYMGLMGHPIADAYQTMMAERVEVLRGPASVLYGSNAMGGVINIVTRKMQEDGIRTNINIGAGSYGSIQTEATNRIRKGRFSSTVTASYNRTDGHRADMAFEQYGGYAKLGYDFTDNWKVWGDVNVTRFNATNPGSVMKPYIDNDQRITRGMTSFALENYYEKTSGALSFFYNWGDHWINDGYQPGGEPLQYRFNSNDQMLGVSWYQSVQLLVCPNQVLRPSGNLMTLMQPEMSYERGYCRPECAKCAEVCPTDAIHLTSLADKSSIQIGHAVWIRKNCVPLTDGINCGNCARHCPVAAIEMVPSEVDNPDSPKIPVVNVERCIGCGACENLCPARPFSAIYVEGHERHRVI